MKQNKQGMLFFLLFITVLLGACQRSASTPAPASIAGTTPIPGQIALSDALGRSVLLPGPPQRIVITGKAMIMIANAAYLFPQAPARIAALGTAQQGAHNFTALVDPNYSQKAVLAQDAGAEQIAAVQPDLVILKSALAETLGGPLDALKIPVVYVDFETPEQYQRDLAILGKVFQDEARAQRITTFYQGTLAEVTARVGSLASKPRVLMLYYTEKDGAVAFSVAPAAWMQTRLVQLAGGVPAWEPAAVSGGWSKVNLEQIAAWDADQVFIISYFKDPSRVVTELEADPQWQQLRAVREGRLFAFPGDLYSWDQPDVRWILGLEWLAARLHPQQFAGYDASSRAETFYRQLYGIDGAFFEKHIRPTFTGDFR